jgi:ABC-type multidrug transport system ATPase subunit
MIEYKNLSKKYGNLQALNVDYLKIEQGSVSVFAGPNGSGKSTLMKIILGLVKSDSGLISNHADLTRIGYYPESVNLPENITASRLYSLLQSLSYSSEDSTSSELAELMGMGTYLKKRLHKLSKGMHKKVGLMLAFTGNPGLVILDEPFEGVDTIDRDKLMTFIQVQSRQNTSVILSTHILDNIDSIADFVFFLKNGKVVCCYDVSSDELSGDYHKTLMNPATEEEIRNILSMDNKRPGKVNDIYRIIFGEQA